MIFCNIKLLKQRLIEEGLSQQHLFIYIFVYILFTEVAIQGCGLLPPEELNKYDYMEIIVYLVAMGIGTYLIYRVNGGSKGKQFAERFFSIGFVVGMRFFVILISIMIILVVGKNQMGDIDLPATWYETIIYSCWSIAFYWRMIVHVKEVANTTRTCQSINTQFIDLV